MCPPKYFNLENKINPWMKEEKVDLAETMKQWKKLKDVVEQCGVSVKVIEPVEGLPDMTFCCNSGTVIGDKVYLSKFRYPSRTGEEKHYKKWFEENGYQVKLATEPFEGGGDAVYCPTESTLWAGYGFRTEEKAYDGIKALGDFKVILCKLIDPRFYHMDTCFALLTPRIALWYPPAFSEETQALIRAQHISLIQVSEEEAKKFVCNSVAFGNTVITPPDCPATKKLLEEEWGFSVVEVNLSQFMKSGGACQCLILKL